MSLNSSLHPSSSKLQTTDHLPVSSVTGCPCSTDSNEHFEMSEISNRTSLNIMKIDDHNNLNGTMPSTDAVDGCLDDHATSDNGLHDMPPSTNGISTMTTQNICPSQTMPNGTVSPSRDRRLTTPLISNGHCGNGHLPLSSSCSSLSNGHLHTSNGSIANGDIHSSTPPRPQSSQSQQSIHPDSCEKTDLNQENGSVHQTISNGHASLLQNGSITEPNSQIETSIPSLAKPALVNGSCKPKKPTPFTLLPGEQLRVDEVLNDGFVYLTNYRLYIEPSTSSRAVEPNVSLPLQKVQYQQSQQPEQEVDSARQTISVPVGAIDSVELRDLCFLVVFTKYVQSFVLSFQTAESATCWLKHLNDANNLKMDQLFCFQFFNALKPETKDIATEYRNHIGQMIALNQKEINMHSDPKELVLKEFRRMNFNSKDWRLCELNKEFRFCSSYPQYFIVPKEMTDKELESVGNFRYSHRIPVVVWRHQKNGCVIARSSQPVVGWLGWRSSQDERLLQRMLDISIRDTLASNSKLKNNEPIQSKVSLPPPLPPPTPLANALLKAPLDNNVAEQSTAPAASEESLEKQKSADCNGTGQAVTSTSNGGHVMCNGTLPTNMSMEKLTTEDSTTKLLILDARSYAAAFANRAMGGGCECAEYYDNCDVQFMSLNNIHSIRKSFHSLRYICESSQIELPNWLTLLDNTKWFHNLSALIKAALVIVDTISIHERPVLVHCSDGWDRTPQVVALAQLMLDPYYRTIDGFKVLVEREWLQFGHKFTDRCRSTTLNIDLNERCPVFLQWLDCVYQLVKQFPSDFEFNVYFLVKLVYHTYSCLFGTFACNNIQERVNEKLYQNTISLWAYMELERNNFTNYLYFQKQEILRPSYRVKDMDLWSEVYVPVSGTSVAKIIPMSDCQENVCNVRNLFVTRTNDMDSSTALNEANIDESGIESDASKVHLSCHSQSKTDLNRSASYESLSCSKLTNGNSNGNLARLSSSHLQSSESESKLHMRHLSDSCLFDANVSNDRDNFLRSSVRNNDRDCDKELLQGTICDALDVMSRDETNQPINGASNHRHFSLSNRPFICSRQCSKVMVAENGGDALTSELLNGVNEPTIDFDGQIVVKEYLQLQQLVVRFKREIDTLTRDLKNAQKTINVLRSQQFLSSRQPEDSNHARKHSTLNGDYDIQQNLNGTCDNQTLCGVVHERSRSAGRSDCPGGPHRPRNATNGFQTSATKDFDLEELFKRD